MKLILKNLKQVEYEIQIESNSITVKDLKLEIEKLYSYDSAQIKLLFQGTLLDNSKVLSSYNIKENSIIIMMNTKSKQFENQSQNTNNNININNSNQNKPQINKEVSNQDITDILKDNLKIQVDSLVDMGFERSQVEIAVKAANGRIDLAIEYLNNGIPDNVNNNRRNNNVRNNNVRNEIMNELKKQASIIKVLCKDDKYMIFSILDNIKRNDPGLLRLITDYRNEFEKLLDTPITEEDENNYKKIETKADNIIQKRLEKEEKQIKEKIEKLQKEREEKEKKEREEKEKKEQKEKEDKEKAINKENNKEEGKEKEKFEEKMEQEDVNKENNNEEKKENMGNNNKEVEKKEIVKMEEEKENIEKNEKVEMKEENFNKNKENKDNQQKDESNNQIQNQLTEEDKEVINRLKNLGDFPYEKVVEAYIVCNKNEELTANYLFEQNN